MGRIISLGGGRQVGIGRRSWFLMLVASMRRYSAVIRTEIAAVAQDGAVLHEASGLEKLLPLGDVTS